MDDLPLQKIAISGGTLASVLQRFSSSAGDVDGLLFGRVTHVTPSNLSDDDPLDLSSTQSNSPNLVATVTSFFCFGSVHSFYDSVGRVDSAVLRSLLGDRVTGKSSLIGWFSGRRRTHLRPSMRESAVIASLSSQMHCPSFFPHSSAETFRFPPCVFFLLTTPFADQFIHTHEYRAFQFRHSTRKLEPKSIDIVNIGPAFRGDYQSFCPNSQFPLLSCQLRGTFMDEDKTGESLNHLKDQKELDMLAEGFEVGSLSLSMGSEAANYTSGLEVLYEKMLVKLDSLARLVEKSSAKVTEKENHNMKLRYRLAGLE